MLAENLNDLEDLYVRSTDSLIEYPTLGRVLSDFPTYLLERKLEIEKKRDDRQPSLAFYKLYLAENLLHHSRKSEGMKLLNDALSTLRPKFDDLLLLHGLMLTLKNIKVDSDEYASIAERAFSLSRASLRNYGLRLPVSSNTKDSKVLAVLEESPFLVKNDSKRLFSIEVEYVNNEYTLMFVSPEGSGGNVKVKGAVLEDIVNKLSDSVFSEDLG